MPDIDGSQKCRAVIESIRQVKLCRATFRVMAYAPMTGIDAMMVHRASRSAAGLIMPKTH
ncbi:MAG TPA: hypothetical protein VKB68_14615 [Stellaceae bacterium]|nr:hypothetical protein [Stellaceae bacterium]